MMLAIPVPTALTSSARRRSRSCSEAFGALSRGGEDLRAVEAQRSDLDKECSGLNEPLDPGRGLNKGTGELIEAARPLVGVERLLGRRVIPTA